MVIERNDFKEIKEVVGQHLRYDTTAILFLPRNGIKKNDLIFCPGYEDIQLFNRHHTSDSDSYKTIDAHALFRIMNKVERGELQPRIITEPDDSRTQYFDLGRMVREHELVDRLHHKMKHADWYYDYSDDRRVWLNGVTEIRGIKEDLKELSQSYEGKYAAHILWKTYVPEHSVAKPDFLQLKHNIMDESTSAFNEGQFKKLGMQEAYTPELVEQMKQGVPFIQHPFPKGFEGDQTNSLIHLKKSPDSDKYFINKFDLNLQKEGEKKAIKQTFYVNNTKKNEQETENGQKQKYNHNFTFKRAYNFTAGRPVYHADSQSWEQIDLSRKLASGNYATQRFDKNYGFDLGKVIDNYSLANPQYKSSLMDSLQRGNLQKEKMVDKNGKVDDFYLSPSIRTGSLNMYDKDKKPVELETQIERALISKELGEKLKFFF
ncbi:MAG: hypothetical protein H3C36_14950 [Chitinophagaceae bacterium]|nr:hypothetical protein [Chitinophagaceae bacterium]